MGRKQKLKEEKGEGSPLIREWIVLQLHSYADGRCRLERQVQHGISSDSIAGRPSSVKKGYESHGTWQGVFDPQDVLCCHCSPSVLQMQITFSLLTKPSSPS